MTSVYRNPPVGIADLGHYAPEHFMTAAQIGERAGIPEEIVVERFGLKGKHIAAWDEHVSDMCIAAAEPIVERNGRADIDAVVYFGSHWKDYAVWQAAPAIQHALGLDGFAMEAVNVSAGAPVALKVVRDMLAADPHLRSVLLVGAAKESQLLDYTNKRARFMINFGDGGVAVLLRRDHPHNVVLGSSILTDGSFSDQVRVPAGGSAHPASHATVDRRMHYLDVRDPQEMKDRLDPITLKNFLKVASQALERSGYGINDVDLLLPIHMKRSIHHMLLGEFGLSENQSIYLDTFGHMSAVDPLLALSVARDEGGLRDGMTILTLAAGTGYSWAASVIRWGSDA
ncbi:MAG TPA: 3-oxoacyl-ACP synthase [Actinomycetota bacterium]|nr:3-oxoacyl-ACP synthase [Actinomycetota bacterium]